MSFRGLVVLFSFLFILVAQLRSQPSGGHVLIPPTSSLASSIQNQLGGLQAPHPLEHEVRDYIKNLWK